MKKYEIEVYYNYSDTFTVEANNEQEARFKAQTELVNTIHDGHTVDDFHCTSVESLKCKEDNIDKDSGDIFEDIQNDYKESLSK